MTRSPRKVDRYWIASSIGISIALSSDGPECDSDLQKAVTCFTELYKRPDSGNSSIGYIDEAIADHVSMLMSWDALHIHLGTFPDSEQKLPTRHEHSFNRLLFISQAYLQCHANNNFSWSQQLKHPPGFHRVNRAASNLHHFHTSFPCSGSDALMAGPRCKLFGS